MTAESGPICFVAEMGFWRENVPFVVNLKGQFSASVDQSGKTLVKVFLSQEDAEDWARCQPTPYCPLLVKMGELWTMARLRGFGIEFVADGKVCRGRRYTPGPADAVGEAGNTGGQSRTSKE